MATRSLSGSSGGGTVTYNTGSKSYTQSQLNNNMSGTDANAIYYATHGGTGNAPVNSGNVTVSGGNNKSSGSSKGGSGSGGGSTSASFDATSLIGNGGGGGVDYASMIESMLAQQRAAAEAAYRASMGRLNQAWDNTQNSLKNNLNSTLDRLKSQLDYSNGIVNDDANKSLREAYINYMMNKKNLNQGLSAMGVSGGATESNMAKMYNNYGSSRNNINTQLARNIADLLNEYNGNVANANQLYNSQYADAMNNYVNNMNGLESALANNIASSYSGSSLSNLASYASALANLNNSGAYTPTENTLSMNKVSTTAGNNMGSVTDYAKWKAMADSLSNQGANTSNIIYQLRQNGAPLDAVYQILGA